MDGLKFNLSVSIEELPVKEGRSARVRLGLRVRVAGAAREMPEVVAELERVTVPALMMAR